MDDRELPLRIAGSKGHHMGRGVYAKKNYCPREAILEYKVMQ